MAQQPTSAGPAEYAERLFVPWWLWLVGLGIAALAATEMFLGWLPYLILLPPTAYGLWRAGRLPVAVRAGELYVDDAHLPLRYVAEVGVLDAAGKRAALGTGNDPLAFVVVRPWVPRAVLVVLDDPADPTPYWVVSSRHPEQLVRAIRVAAGSATG